jgi:hypothetical protein
MRMKAGDLIEFDWNFDAVPDKALVACCYWEYARESEFLRELRKRCQKCQQSAGVDETLLHADLQKVQSIGYPAKFFLHGFFCPPDGVLPDALPLKPGEVHRLTGSFPKPWQLLTKEEREYRAFIPPRGIVDFVQIVPFQRGLFLDAKDIVEMVKSQRRQRDMANAEARRANPRLTDEVLARLGKLQFPDIQPSVIYASGTENTVVQISWGLFTNEEIIQAFRQWVKANRPEDIPAPDGKGRNKARDWRVALERLAIMRLLHEFRLRDLSAECPKAWRLYGKRECYKERKRAGEMFHRLFPFLSRSEPALNWPTQGGRSR